MQIQNHSPEEIEYHNAREEMNRASHHVNLVGLGMYPKSAFDEHKAAMNRLDKAFANLPPIRY